MFLQDKVFAGRNAAKEVAFAYHRLVAAITKFPGIPLPEAAFFITLRLFFTVSIEHRHPTENHSFLHNNDDIHAIPHQTAYHAPNICTNMVYVQNIQNNT